MKIAGNVCRPSITDTSRNEELTLIAVLFPLQVVFAPSGIKSGKMSRQYLTMLPAPGAAQPVTAFQSSRKYFEAVPVILQQPPWEHVISINGPAFAYRHFDFYICHQGSIEQQICL